MRKSFFACLLFLVAQGLHSQALSYYLPDSLRYDPAVPTPRDVIHHEVGEWHVTHDRLVDYMKAVAAAAPGRVKLETMGYTYERRPQVLLIITSKKNHDNLEAIRQQHLLLSDPSRSSSLDIDKMPIVVWIGHSIHGNEASGSNASLLGAYYLAAAQGRQIDELLDNTIILFDPSFNPDGMQRFSTWVNQHRSKNLVSDPNSREFNEVWPGGRFNHYWFDLNRDWLPAVHVESQHRLEWFHRWKPNILTDHHEQGSNATFFFQPGVPSRVNPLTPSRNQELTASLGTYHAAFLDRIGSLYFTRENYDDFYYGKGSTYPDINGSIGILFEQASSRGHLQQTANGPLSFPFTIRNQFVTVLSTLEGAKALRRDFLQWQRDFYKTAVSEAASSAVKAYVFGDPADQGKTALLVNLLRKHQISVHKLKKDLTVKEQAFRVGSSFVVPVQQPQYRLIRNIFEKTFDYRDSLFYDITTWTMPLALDIPYAGLNASQYGTQPPGDAVTADMKQEGSVSQRSDYAYIMEYTEMMAPAALYNLLSRGVLAKVATNPFRVNLNGYPAVLGYGSILIPVKMQTMDSEKLFGILREVAARDGVVFHAVASGSVLEGSDLGSNRFVSLTRPAVAMITGTGVNALDAGEVWHLLDQRMNIPATHLEPSVFNRADLSGYNTLVMVGGNYNELNKDKLRAWVQSGGVLILMEEAVTWAAQQGISEVKMKRAGRDADSAKQRHYTDRDQVSGAQQLRGAIFRAGVDLTHPLAYGYTRNQVSLFKGNRVFMEKSRSPYATPFYYGDNPLESGWASRENKQAVRGAGAVVVNALGSGRVINISENPNFRAFWLGSSRIFLNAIFFGKIIDAASARAED